MARLTRHDARSMAAAYAIPLKADFCALDSATVERVLALADLLKYRRPVNANGSRGRYFHAHLQRTANREAD